MIDLEKSKETREYLQTGVVKNPTPLHEEYNHRLLQHKKFKTLKHLSSCSGVGFFTTPVCKYPLLFYFFSIQSYYFSICNVFFYLFPFFFNLINCG